MRKFVVCAAVLPLISGCAHMQSRAIAYEDPSSSQMFVWRSDYSAGIGSNGNMCAQAATTARTAGASADGSVNNSVIAAVSPQLRELPAGEAAQLTASLQQNAMLTNSTNGQTAYANIAFFYFCQISANAGDKLTRDDIVKMWSDVNIAAPKIGLANSGTSSISTQAPALPRAVSQPTPPEEQPPALPPPAEQ